MLAGQRSGRTGVLDHHVDDHYTIEQMDESRVGVSFEFSELAEDIELSPDAR